MEIRFISDKDLVELRGFAIGGVLLATLAYVCDSFTPLLFQVLVSFARTFGPPNRRPRDGNIMYPVGALIAHGVAFIVPFRGPTTIYFMGVLVLQSACATFIAYVYHDEPPGIELEAARSSCTGAGFYLVTAILLRNGKATISYLFRNIYACDPLSIKMFVTVCVVLGFRARFVDRPWDILRTTRNKISHLDDRFELLRLWLLGLFWKAVRKELEELDKRRSSFHDLPVYKYQNLGHYREIRLLRLKKRHLFSGAINSQILHVDLDDLPPYEAISYTWGEPSPSHEILVDGCRFPITTSLHELLHARSSFWRERLLWVDYICIKQGNSSEKAQQIPLMREIYHRASRTVVWLGDPYDAPLATAMLHDVVKSIQSPNYSTIAFYDYYYHQTNRPRWIALVKLFRHPYFSRVWVCQEIAVAKKLQLYHAGRYISWDTLIQAMSKTSHPHVRSLVQFQYEDLDSDYIDSFQNAKVLGLFRTLTVKSMSLPLGFALSYCASFESTNVEDRVFGLLGLSTDTSRSSIIREYGKPVRDVYTKAAETLLTSPENSIFILPYAGIGYARNMNNLPTWSPDWSTDQVGARLTTLYLPHTEYTLVSGVRYSASGRSEPQISIGPIPGSLQIKGVQVDVIRKLTTVLEPPRGTYESSEGDEIIQLCVIFHAEAFQLTREGVYDPYPSGQRRIDAFWRTIIADRSEEEHPAPSYYGQYYCIWLETYKLMLTGKPLHLLEPSIRQLQDPLARRAWPPTQRLVAANSDYCTRFAAASVSRRFCVTDGGYMGLVPPNAKVGDLVCIIFGMQTPYLLRPIVTTNHKEMSPPFNPLYQLVGECYIHGMMRGEMMMSTFGKEDTAFTVV